MEGRSSCCFGDFEKTLRQARLPVMVALEEQVLGSNYGGTSWTTRSQAGQMAQALKLDAKGRHLEIGSGAGWPGLYYADDIGCRVTQLDVPLLAHQYSLQRARADGLLDRVEHVQASAASMPFADQSFTSIGHSDVLCCLPEKQEVLEDCRRVIVAGGIMVFTIIYVPDGLPEQDRKLAEAAGPPFVYADQAYPALLRKCGWRIQQRYDLTEQYNRSLSILGQGIRQRWTDLVAGIGEEDARIQLDAREAQVEATRRKALKRECFVVRAD